MTQPPLFQAPQTGERQRLSIEVSPALLLLLDNISAVTGVPKSQLVTGALLDAMPTLLERTKQLQAAAAALQAPTPPRGKK